MRIGLIGLGGMGKVVVAELHKANTDSVIEIVGAIVAPEDLSDARQTNKFDVPVLDDFQALMALQPEVIAECAGHAAVRQYGEQILGAGIPFVVISIGVLADKALYECLSEAAQRNNVKMLLPCLSRPGPVCGPCMSP